MVMSLAFHPRSELNSPTFNFFLYQYPPRKVLLEHSRNLSWHYPIIQYWPPELVAPSSERTYYYSTIKFTLIHKYKIIPLGRISQSRSSKGQLISKATYGLLTSPKKRTDEFVLFALFAFLLFTANKSNSSVRFLGESTACQSALQMFTGKQQIN